MPRLTDQVVDDIVKCCLSAYNNLPKSGKPVESEWTVLSCVVQLERPRGECRAVSLGAGCKAAGAAGAAGGGGPLGARLADCHGEVVARRALLAYLLQNMLLASQSKHSIFEKKNNKFILKEHIEFVFYSSQLPCGDASIIPKNADDEHFGDLLKPAKRRAGDGICDTESKKTKVDGDIHRTGAKCLPHSEQDPKTPGMEYHLLGQVRTKPGRGDPTLSVSCSDKMARWIHTGIQGALLHMLCGIIHIKHFVFGAGVPYSEESLRRALLTRDGDFVPKHVPEFYQSSITFPHIRSGPRVRPAPGSIVWFKGSPSSEVVVQGRKLGLTKKQLVSPRKSLSICKYKLYEKFIDILLTNLDIKQDILKGATIENVPYNEMKRKSVEYLELWSRVKEKLFKTWTVKPDIWNFCLESPTQISG